MSDSTYELAPLSSEQLAIIESPLDARIFLEGPAGCGKTTAGVERMLRLMEAGVPGSSILVLVPQRTLAAPYYEALQSPGVVAGGMVTVLTIGGLAQRMVDLFWPLVASQAGFAHPEHPPTFLTLETAQYYMAHLVRPLLDQGFFDSITINRNRLYSQILDNLNKAAVAGFPYTEIGERLKSAWVGEPGQARVYENAQECALRFRAYCLEHNLLDFSLQLEVFVQHLWHTDLCRNYLTGAYRHVIFDNLEEDTPIAHELLAEWLPEFDSALLIYDQDAGYRRFLGANPESAAALRELCGQHAVLGRSFVSSLAVQSLGEQLAHALDPAGNPPSPLDADGAEALAFEIQRYFPQMLDWVVEQIAYLVQQEQIPPGEIVVLAPFLSDSLRFSLAVRLERAGIAVRSHRPSRSLRDEPVTQSLLTLAALAHPDWEMQLTRFDVTYAFMQAIDGLDLVRAQLLTEAVFRYEDKTPVLLSFDQVKPGVQERITYRMGERFEGLRLWLGEYVQGAPEEFDHFLSRLFGELLSQPGYGFHGSYTAGEITANLVESVQKFRWAVGDSLLEENIPLGKEYMFMVLEGVIAAQYIRSWQTESEESVLLAPAYTFLMANRPAAVQFWLDTGSRSWFERLYQPLTHPYVLSRSWQPGRIWTNEDEYQANQDTLSRLALGLTRRCQMGVYLGLSQFNEQGSEDRGPLLQALQRVLQQSPPTDPGLAGEEA